MNAAAVTEHQRVGAGAGIGPPAAGGGNENANGGAIGYRDGGVGRTAGREGELARADRGRAAVGGRAGKGLGASAILDQAQGVIRAIRNQTGEVAGAVVVADGKRADGGAAVIGHDHAGAVEGIHREGCPQLPPPAQLMDPE